jgi:hypothetical protein
VREIDVGAVKQDDLAGADASADFAGTGVVVVTSGVDDGEAREQALQIEPQMALGGGLAPAVAGPVQTVGHQRDGGGVDHVDHALEASGEPAKPSAGAKRRLQALEMRKHGPKQPLGHGRVAVFVGVRKTVATGWRCTTDAGEPANVMVQRIAGVI